MSAIKEKLAAMRASSNRGRYVRAGGASNEGSDVGSDADVELQTRQGGGGGAAAEGGAGGEGGQFEVLVPEGAYPGASVALELPSGLRIRMGLPQVRTPPAAPPHLR